MSKHPKTKSSARAPSTDSALALKHLCAISYLLGLPPKHHRLTHALDIHFSTSVFEFQSKLGQFNDLVEVIIRELSAAGDFNNVVYLQRRWGHLCKQWLMVRAGALKMRAKVSEELRGAAFILMEAKLAPFMGFLANFARDVARLPCTEATKARLAAFVA